MSSPLVAFRGGSTLEYRNQNIKLLRATEGELTRSRYRLARVHDEVRELLRIEPNPIATATLIDPTASRAFPVRQLIVADHQFDDAAGYLDLTYAIGPFVRPASGAVEEPLARWDDAEVACPPRTLVARWRSTWPAVVEVAGEEAVSRWRAAIEFLTASWEFRLTGFFALEDLGAVTGKPNGPQVDVSQSRETTIRLRSYNPHLAPEVLDTMRLRVGQSGGLVDIERGDGDPLDRDGQMEVVYRCLEPGPAFLNVTVEPDPQYSTYLPLTLEVAADPALAATRPRLLGPEWVECLERIAELHVDEQDVLLSVLDELGRAFPGDPFVLQHKGRVFYEKREYGEARALLDASLAIQDDSRTVAWSLFAALRMGDTDDAVDLIHRFNPSKPDLFERFVAVAAELPEAVGLGILDAVGEVFGDALALRLFLALGSGCESEQATCTVTRALRSIDENMAFAYLREAISGHGEWRGAASLLFDVAAETGRVDEVSQYAAQALRWSGEGPDEFRARWGRLERMVHPEVRGSLLMENVHQMLDAGPAARELAIEQACEAAEWALHHARLLTVYEAIELVFANADSDSAAGAAALEVAGDIERQLVNALEALDPSQSSIEHYTARLYKDLLPVLRGKTLFVLGGPTRRPEATDWERELELRRLEWLPSSPASPVDEERITEADPANLVVVELRGHMGHVKAGTKAWLRRNGVPDIVAFGLGSSVLEVLHGHFCGPALDGPPSRQRRVGELCFDSHPLGDVAVRPVHQALGLVPPLLGLDVAGVVRLDAGQRPAHGQGRRFAQRLLADADRGSIGAHRLDPLVDHVDGVVVLGGQQDRVAPGEGSRDRVGQHLGLAGAGRAGDDGEGHRQRRADGSLLFEGGGQHGGGGLEGDLARGRCRTEDDAERPGHQLGVGEAGHGVEVVDEDPGVGGAIGVAHPHQRAVAEDGLGIERREVCRVVGVVEELVLTEEGHGLVERAGRGARGWLGVRRRSRPWAGTSGVCGDGRSRHRPAASWARVALPRCAMPTR